MKKIFSTALLAVALLGGVALTSCSKDKSCTCTETDLWDGSKTSRELDPESFGAKNCSDLEVKLRAAQDDDFDYSCK